jgi:hypothetical protein
MNREINEEVIKMRAQLLRRLKALEQRVTPEAELLPRLPQWYLRAWEAHLGVPVDEYGQPNFAAINRDQTEQRVAADSIPAETQERRSPDVAGLSEALRFD